MAMFYTQVNLLRSLGIPRAQLSQDDELSFNEVLRFRTLAAIQSLPCKSTHIPRLLHPLRIGLANNLNVQRSAICLDPRPCLALRKFRLNLLCSRRQFFNRSSYRPHCRHHRLRTPLRHRRRRQMKVNEQFK